MDSPSYRKRCGVFFIDLLTRILYAVVGFPVVANPRVTAIALTLLTAMFLTFGEVWITKVIPQS